MTFTCRNCPARYSIADTRVRGKLIRLRCKRCHTNNVVFGGPRLAVVAPIAAPAPQSRDKQAA